MESGSKITGNTNANSGYGGGVYVDSGGKFTKQSGGVIYGSDTDGDLKNTASDGGHAVYVKDGSKKRDSTAGKGVTLDSTKGGKAGGWEVSPMPATSLQAALRWLDSYAEEGDTYTITLSADEFIAPKTLSYNVPAVCDVLPARIRACVARPGLAKCAGTIAWEWSEAK